LVARCKFENPRRIFQNAVNFMWTSRHFFSKVRETLGFRLDTSDLGFLVIFSRVWIFHSVSP
jgi:hypothetical protein